ncbi:NAD(P)/FAD-dependent oxidoreductase [Pseudochelatococcus sp. B33]
MAPSSLTNLYAVRPDTAAPRPAVAGDLAADVCIVGAGFTGLGAALTLAQAGADVRVVEAAQVGGGASGVNGGQVHPGQRRDQAWLEARVGHERARALWDIAEEARLWLHEVIGAHAIDCGFRSGLLAIAHRPRHFRALAEEAGHLTRRYGVAGLEVLEGAAIEKYTRMRGAFGGVFNPHGGHLDPLALTRGLARAAEEAGARLHEGSRVVRVAPEGGSWRVVTDAGAVRARSVLLTGDGSLGALSELVAAHVMPLVNFMIATAPLEAALAGSVLSGRIAASDTRYVVNYFRRTDDDRIIFGGGESYGDSLPDDFARRVRGRMLGLYPQLADAPIAHGWGGRLGITATRLPFVRRPEVGLYAASGFSGQGVMLGPYTGRIVAQAIMGDDERFRHLAALPVPPLPGGRWLRRPLLTAAMIGFGLLDRF